VQLRDDSCVRTCSITYTSDYFVQMFDMARKMIRAGDIYADDTDVETMRAERMKCIESRNRGMQPVEAERVFDQMLLGSEVCRSVCSIPRV
jgi:glutamyl-tRNA synthetase